MKTALAIGVFFAVIAGGLYLLVQNKAAPYDPGEPASVMVQEGVSVPVYYYMQARDVDARGNALCSRDGIVAVERKLPEGHTLKDRIDLLLLGELSSRERAEGISTEFPLAGLRLTNVEINDRGKATLTFEDVLNKTTGGACRVAILWYQIEKTARDYPGVRDVEFRPETLFQP